MSIDPAVLDALVAAGATGEMIAAAVKADLAKQETKRAEKRAKDAERKRRSRDVTRIPSDTPPVTRIPSDPFLEKRVSPTPPSETQTIPSPSPPKGGSVPKISGDFDAFWTAYPRKTDKGNARKAYIKALAKISGPDPPALLLGALERVKATWTDAQWIPHPTTWLNGERWDDEPETQVIPIRPQNGRSDPLRSELRPDPKRAAREANYRRAFAGSEIAARNAGER